MFDSTQEISLEVWQQWILDAISKIRSQKQRPSVQRICQAIGTHHKFHEDIVAEKLEQIVETGAVIKVYNKGLHSYKAPMAKRVIRVEKNTNLCKVVARAVHDLGECEGSSIKSIENYIQKFNTIEMIGEADYKTVIKQSIKKAVEAGFLIQEGKLYKKGRSLTTPRNSNASADVPVQIGNDVCKHCSGNAQKNLNGIPEPLSSCKQCGISLHTTCANIAAKCKTQSFVLLYMLVTKGTSWYCENCVKCNVCGKGNKGPCLLQCFVCQKNYHLSCLDTIPDKKPKHPYRCSTCLKLNTDVFRMAKGKDTQKKNSNTGSPRQQAANTSSPSNRANNVTCTSSTTPTSSPEKYWPAGRQQRGSNSKTPIKSQAVMFENHPSTTAMARARNLNAEETLKQQLSAYHEAAASLKNRNSRKRTLSNLSSSSSSSDSDDEQNNGDEDPDNDDTTSSDSCSHSQQQQQQKQQQNISTTPAKASPNSTKSSLSEQKPSMMIKYKPKPHQVITEGLNKKSTQQPIQKKAVLLKSMPLDKKDLQKPPEEEDDEEIPYLSQKNVIKYKLLEDMTTAKCQEKQSDTVTNKEPEERKPWEVDTDENPFDSQPLPNGVTQADVDIYKRIRERAKLAITGALESPSKLIAKPSLVHSQPDRCPGSIEIGKWHIETWYSSPFPQEYARLTKLYLCEFCLKYTKSRSVLDRHQNKCTWKQPPGTEIYRHQDLSVFEVDGNINKIYCQNLCLLAKLFLDHKTLYYDVEPFLFYVLTKNDNKGCHLVGYFSKEKHCAQKYNVSCILTMPQFQRQGFGRFLIDFSYLLSREEGQLGTPEKPLSDLGRLSYFSYWKSIILEYMYDHRNDEKITFHEIAMETGLTVSDIALALELLNFIKLRKNEHDIRYQINIKVDWQNVIGHQERLRRRNNRILIEPERLRWSPLLSNLKNTSLDQSGGRQSLSPRKNNLQKFDDNKRELKEKTYKKETMGKCKPIGRVGKHKAEIKEKVPEPAKESAAYGKKVTEAKNRAGNYKSVNGPEKTGNLFPELKGINDTKRITNVTTTPTTKRKRAYSSPSTAPIDVTMKVPEVKKQKPENHNEESMDLEPPLEESKVPENANKQSEENTTTKMEATENHKVAPAPSSSRAQRLANRKQSTPQPLKRKHEEPAEVAAEILQSKPSEEPKLKEDTIKKFADLKEDKAKESSKSLKTTIETEKVKQNTTELQVEPKQFDKRVPNLFPKLRAKNSGKINDETINDIDTDVKESSKEQENPIEVTKMEVQPPEATTQTAPTTAPIKVEPVPQQLTTVANSVIKSTEAEDKVLEAVAKKTKKTSYQDNDLERMKTEVVTLPTFVPTQTTAPSNIELSKEEAVPVGVISQNIASSVVSEEEQLKPQQVQEISAAENAKESEKAVLTPASVLTSSAQTLSTTSTSEASEQINEPVKTSSNKSHDDVKEKLENPLKLTSAASPSAVSTMTLNVDNVDITQSLSLQKAENCELKQESVSPVNTAESTMKPSSLSVDIPVRQEPVITRNETKLNVSPKLPEKISESKASPDSIPKTEIKLTTHTAGVVSNQNKVEPPQITIPKVEPHGSGSVGSIGLNMNPEKSVHDTKQTKSQKSKDKSEPSKSTSELKNQKSLHGLSTREKQGQNMLMAQTQALKAFHGSLQIKEEDRMLQTMTSSAAAAAAHEKLHFKPAEHITNQIDLNKIAPQFQINHYNTGQNPLYGNQSTNNNNNNSGQKNRSMTNQQTSSSKYHGAQHVAAAAAAAAAAGVLTSLQQQQQAACQKSKNDQNINQNNANNSTGTSSASNTSDDNKMKPSNNTQNPSQQQAATTTVTPEMTSPMVYSNNNNESSSANNNNNSNNNMHHYECGLSVPMGMDSPASIASDITQNSSDVVAANTTYVFGACVLNWACGASEFAPSNVCSLSSSKQFGKSALENALSWFRLIIIFCKCKMQAQGLYA
uniref:histone acetyltransferase n=1 Tax=Glossina pallidipes TaxID=7398 RepID=A0A1A9ZV15_GLOPL